MKDFNKILELDPNNYCAYSNRGNSKNDLGLYKEAIEDYNKALKINPNFADAYYNRGNSKK